MKIHFIGIGGIGVSALAKYYLEKGCQITGSDLVDSEIIKNLEKLGAKIFIGKHKVKNLPKNVDLVIYSPAVKSDNPELKRAYKLKSNIQYPISNIQIKSYPEALGELTKKYFTIAISGTHGKSTTAAMVALILIKAGLDPTVILGTKLKEFGDSNFRMGKSPEEKPSVPMESRILDRVGTSHGARKYLIIEADEHFTSFLNYWPKIIILTNIEKDHLDYYKNLNNILRAFKKFISHLPKNGILVANGDDKNIKTILGGRTSFGGSTSLYSLKQKETKKLKKILKVPGEYNIYNTLAALSAARLLKIPDNISFKALSQYRGTWRRFEIKKLVIDHWLLVIIQDYAHHPTEVKATLKAAREKFPRKEIWCVYQPHQYQRTYYLFKNFLKVFSESLRQDQGKPFINKLIITDIYDVTGREEKTIRKKVSSKKLVEAVKKRQDKSEKRQVIYIPTIKKTASYIKNHLGKELVIIIMGAGDIYTLESLLVG